MNGRISTSITLISACLLRRVQVDALLLFAQLYNTKVMDKPEDKAMKPLIDRAVRTVNEALQVAGKAENRSLRALVLFKRAEKLGFPWPTSISRDVGGWRVGPRTMVLAGRPRSEA